MVTEETIEEKRSNTVVTRERAGAQPEALFPTSAVVLSSSAAGWRDISAERLCLSLDTPAHHHAGHFLTLHLGPPALVEWTQGARHRRLHMTPGQLTLIGADVPHQVRYENAEVLAISLTPTLIDRVAQEMAAETGHDLSRNTVELIESEGIADPQVQRIGQLLMTELESGGVTGPLFADALGQALAAHLLRQYSTIRSPQTAERDIGGLSPTRLRRALDFLETHLDRNVTLSEIADAAGLSPYHFARQFKAVTGLAPHHYLIVRRIERAKTLLTQTDLPISAIAAATGFAHHSHLTRHFKRLVGTTPARFNARSG